tara:strand:- start:4086 stop:8291 length:4206 start_codon:yes stop_codon:yes gene_type:complete
MVSYKDITSSGGDAISPLNFPESVPKYDPSSFYNWEQDNIPLWVLEERGNTLWSQAGFPGGNPGGITFVLSSLGNFDESQGIYDNINDILERIPKRLKFPVLVELCTYGALGSLDLANITCEGDGKLEFRNQAYFEDVNASAVESLSTSMATSPFGDAPHLVSSISIDASGQMLGASSTRSETVFGNQGSWNSNARTFTMQGPDTDRQANNLTVSIFSGNDIGSRDAGVPVIGLYSLPPYTSGVDYTIPTGDANPVYGSGTPEDRLPSVPADYPFMEQKRESQLTRGQSTLVGYGNWFSSINAKDCQGTIIFRNILVDGSNQKSDNDSAGCQHLTETGWNIESSDIILDNTASIRNSTNGYFFKNSRLRITGHFMGWRNYTKTGKLTSDRKKDGVGLLAVNSDLLWDSTYYPNSRKFLNWFGKSNRGIELRNSTMRGGIYSTIVSGLPNGGSQTEGLNTLTPMGTDLLFCSGAGGDLMTTIVNTPDCNEAGIYLEGSDVEFYGRLNSYLNQGDGIKANRSQLRLPQFTCNHNGGYGLNLQGSQLTYGWGVDKIIEDVGSDFRKLDSYDGTVYTNTAMSNAAPNTGLRIRNRAQFHCSDNNQNILATKSSAISPRQMNNIPAFYGRWGGADWTNTGAGVFNLGINVLYTPMSHFGATPYRENNLPGIVITNNSDAEMVNVNYTVSSVDTGKGKIAVASNGSNLIFRGTSGCTTTMNYFPVNDEAAQFRSWLAAGVVGTDNSNIEMTGPTKIARFGIPVLTENNSNFSVNPPTLVGTDNIIDVSGYNLIDPTGGTDTSSNHTSIELHSTRSCMVANKQSNIRMYALGGKVVSPHDATTVAVDSVDVLATGYADTFLGDQNNQFVLSTSGGYAKFYPNAFVSGLVFDQGPELAFPAAMDPTLRYLLNNEAVDPSDRHENGTTGGMVARIVGGSNLDVNLINFQMFCQPGTLSGAFFNFAGSGCEYIRDVAGGDGGNIDPPTGPGTDGAPHPGAAGWVIGEMPDGDFIGGSTNSVRNQRNSGQILTNSQQMGGPVNDNDGQGDIYSPAGKGNNLNSTFQGNANPASTEVFGDGFLDEDRSTRLGMYYRKENGSLPSTSLEADPYCMGTPIHIWNIADTSRIHASNLLINGLDPQTASMGEDATGTNAQNWHGPGGKWWNGVSLDYFGAGGRRSTYGTLGPHFYNCGIYRLILSTRGDLKGMYDVSTLSGNSTDENGWHNTVSAGGSFVDQINGQGYTHFTQNTRMLGTADPRNITNTDSDMPGGIYQLSSCLRVFGWGHPSRVPNNGVAQMSARVAGFSAVQAVSSNVTSDDAYIYTNAAPAFPPPPLNMDWQGYMRNWMDDTASNTFQNAKHLAEDKVNGISIYRSHRGSLGGGEGREAGTGANNISYGQGVRSLNLFDFERLM